MDGFPAEPFTGLEISRLLEWDDLSREDLVNMVKQAAGSVRGQMIRNGQAVSDADLNLAFRLEPGRWFEIQAEPGTFERLKGMFIRS